MGFALIMGILFADGVLLLALRKNAANDALEVDLLIVIDPLLANEDDGTRG